MRTIHRDIVTVLVFSKDGKLLQGKKDSTKGGVYSDCWHPPGGGIDEGEDRVAAARREVFEETGVDITSYPLEFIENATGESEKVLKDTGEKVLCKMKFNLYKVVIDNKNADEIVTKPGDDLAELQWFTLPELKTIKLPPPSAEAFTRFGWI